MRFYENGPDIPDTLIEARDLGEVVFFCGAGISAAVGLPTFDGLADDLLRRLAAQESLAARQRGESLDRVFNAMVKEFGGTAVDREISRALRTPRRADLRYHAAALDLSRGADGIAKVVTTNFDLLFERADRALRSYVPPALPDLAQLQPIQGIVYLHGRLIRAAERRAGYVITSADFGRAYLAEGWAARFVRGLRERYTIVLLGYSANDPPMRYLLEGLNSREDFASRTMIYAFAAEGEAASDEAWRDKGVTTIAYEPRDAGHSGLWDTLFAWAEAGRDPEAWRDRLVSLAQRQPADLRPFERGQVAHLVGSKAGAAAFASAKPPPPAEWLCVLDANVRYGRPGRVNWREEVEIDPLDVFGLDSDPPRPEPRPGGGIEAPGDDLIRWRRGDQAWPDRQRLSGFHAEWNNQLPHRLYQLSRWLAEVMDQPQAVWWAATNPLPHPGLLREIRNRLDRRGELEPPARYFWQCYLEASRARAEDLHDLRRYELVERIKSEGWGPGVLRELERIIAPSFETGRAILGSPVPPKGGWDVVSLREVADIKVTVASWPHELKPASEMLSAVVALVRRSLQRMAELLGESTTLYWRTPTLHPTGERGESFGSGRKASHFLKFKELLVALIEHDREAARREIAEWDSNDPIFFAKLFLFAAAQPSIVTPAEAAARMLAMSDEVFWDGNLSRELLFALRAQWGHLRDSDRRRIERRIIKGHPPYEGDSRREHQRRRSARAASWLRWLELNSRTLSDMARQRLPRLMAADPRWSDDWAWAADDSNGPWGGTIERVSDPQGLGEAALPDVVELAEALSTDDLRQLRDYRPFAGLVASYPYKALAALRLASRRGEYPVRFWLNLVDEWPEGVAPRLIFLMGHTLARLPESEFATMRHGIASWVQRILVGLIRSHRTVGLVIFDAIVARYLQAEPQVLNSGVGFSTVGGVAQEKSEVSLMKAINAPGGKLARTLVELLGKRSRPGRMPRYLAARLDRLLLLPGDGGGHAACVMARHLSWFEHWFSEWTAKFLDLLRLEHPLAEAAWHGLSADSHFLSDDGRRAIKADLLALLRGEASWELDKDARDQLVQQMTVLTFARDGHSAVITHAQVRQVLMALNHGERAESVAVLARSMQSEGMWRSFVRPFILDAWPRQLRYQSEATARQFALIAEKAGEHFVEVVETILPFLRPVAHLDTFAYRLKQQDEEGEGYSARFPAETLRLLDALVGDDPHAIPWNLGELIETIALAAPPLRQSDAWRRLRALTQ